MINVLTGKQRKWKMMVIWLGWRDGDGNDDDVAILLDNGMME